MPSSTLTYTTGKDKKLMKRSRSHRVWLRFTSSVGLAFALLALLLGAGYGIQRAAAQGAAARPGPAVPPDPATQPAAPERPPSPICNGGTFTMTDAPVGISNQPSSNWLGSRVAFWSTSDLVPSSALGNRDGNVEIFLAARDGNPEFAQATASDGTILGGFNLSPSLDRAGTRMAFFSDRDLTEENPDGNFEIFLAELDSTGMIRELHQVTHTTKRSNILPSISYDGRRIAFASDYDFGENPDENQEIFVANWVGNGTFTLQQVTRTGGNIVNDAPALSGDGHFVAYSANRAANERFDIYRIAVEAGATPILLSPFLTPTHSLVSEQPAISEDGHRVAFVSNVVGTGQSAVYLAELDENSTPLPLRLVTSDPVASSRHPSISGDGTRLVFVSNGDFVGRNAERLSQIFAYDSAGEGFDQLTESSDPRVIYSYPVISGNGSQVIFASNQDGNRRMMRTICPYADLSVAQLQSSPHITAGNLITYQIVISNAGPNDATGLELTQILTDGSSFEPDEGDTDWVCGDATCQLITALPPLSVGHSHVATFSIRVATSVLSGTPIANLAEVTAVELDRNEEDNRRRLAGTVRGQSQLTVEQASHVDVLDLNQGDLLTYTIQVKNNGPSTSPSIMVTDTLPEYVRFEDASDGGDVTPSGQVVWPVFTLTPDEPPRLLTLRVRVNDALPSGVDSLTNHVRVRDRRGAHHASSATTGLLAEPALLVQLADGVEVIAPERELRYQIDLDNPGHQMATGLVLTTTLPTHTVFLNATPGYIHAGQTVTWSLPSLAVGQPSRYTMTVRVTPTLPAGVDALEGKVAVRDDGSNSNLPGSPIRASDSDLTTVLAQPRFALSVGDGLTETLPGSLVLYQIHLTNTGNQDATGIWVRDILPPLTQATFVEASGGATPAGGIVSWGIPDLSAGASRLFTISLATAAPPLLPGIHAVTHHVQVQDDGQNSPAPIIALAEDQTALRAAPLLTLLNDGGLATILPDTPITYTLRVENEGNQVASGVVLTDRLPPLTRIVTPTTGGVYEDEGHLVRWEIGTVPVGEPKVFTVSLWVADSLTMTELVNVATVADDGTNSPLIVSATASDTTEIRATLGGWVWEDVDGNGLQDEGEAAGLAGVTVRLYQNGLLFATTMTSVTGNYDFGPLSPTEGYQLRFESPIGYAFTQSLAGDQTRDSDVVSPTGETAAFSLFPARHERSLDAGLYRPTSVGGIVWEDSDANGWREEETGRVEAVPVMLVGQSHAFTDTMTTNASGQYTFTGLMPGIYQLVFSPPVSYVLTLNDQVTDTIDSDPHPITGRTTLFSLDSGMSAGGWDAGVTAPSEVGDRVWLDRNGNGAQDPIRGEENFTETLTITLYYSSTSTLVQHITTTTGSYTFTNLPPGFYYLIFDKPEGYRFTTCRANGIPSDQDSDATSTGRTVPFSLSPLTSPDHSLDAGIRPTEGEDGLLRREGLVAPNGCAGTILAVGASLYSPMSHPSGRRRAGGREWLATVRAP